MGKSIDIIKKPRLAILELIKDLSIEHLNIIPPGFNNNIIWNLGHLVAAQQGVYRRSGLDTVVSADFYKTYCPDTKPERFIDKDELEEIKRLFNSTLDQFVKDYNNNVFLNYVAWNNQYGIDITNIEESFRFLPFHEGLHISYIMAQRKVILNLL